MPIKEIMALSAALMGSIMLTHPTRPLEAVREVEVRILHEVGRADNWGNPSIFTGASHGHRSAVTAHLKTPGK